jgi:hypothetical protein
MTYDHEFLADWLALRWHGWLRQLALSLVSYNLHLAVWWMFLFFYVSRHFLPVVLLISRCSDIVHTS